jgi:hypothetical protein
MRRSSTVHFLNARLPSYPGMWSARSGWNLTHQHPPKMPLCRSTSAAKSFHVSGISGLIIVEPGSWVALTPTVPGPVTWIPIPSRDHPVRSASRATIVTRCVTSAGSSSETVPAQSCRCGALRGSSSI